MSFNFKFLLRKICLKLSMKMMSFVYKFKAINKNNEKLLKIKVKKS